MSSRTSGDSGSVLWTGKPWITPAAAARTVVVAVVAVAVVLLEVMFVSSFVFDNAFLGLPLAAWTVVVLFLVWLFSLMHLLLLRASNMYVLRNDSLEIRTGILTTRAFVVAASGFADMEVTKSVIGRILNYGDIVIRTQDESGHDRVMQKIKDPLSVTGRLREVMSRPIVRVEGQAPPEPRK